MQFRDRRRVIQIIRTTYDPAIKRGRSELVGRLDKADPVIDDALRAACAPDELAEIESFIASRANALSQREIEEAAHSLPERMRAALLLFRDADASGALAAEIYAAWDELKAALHKAGYRKPKKLGKH